MTDKKTELKLTVWHVEGTKPSDVYHQIQYYLKTLREKASWITGTQLEGIEA